MLDLSWTEIAVIAVVALVVIGPKDLPRVLRTIGQWTGKARSMAREFQNSMEDLAREADVADLKKTMDEATSFDVKKQIGAMVDPDGSLERAISESTTLEDTDLDTAPAKPVEAQSRIEPPRPEGEVPRPRPAAELGGSAETLAEVDGDRAPPGDGTKT